MTKDEIKSQYKMADILSRYGLRPNRSGFICCPFHKEKTASMKIYEDSYYCFGCGETGDIFTFIMQLNNVSFRDAFLSLGGTYEKSESKNDARHRKRDLLIAERKRQKEIEDIEKKKKEILLLAKMMDDCRISSYAYIPFSDAWCECMEGYTKAMANYDLLREEVSKTGTDKN